MLCCPNLLPCLGTPTLETTTGAEATARITATQATQTTSAKPATATQTTQATKPSSAKRPSEPPAPDCSTTEATGTKSRIRAPGAITLLLFQQAQQIRQFGCIVLGEGKAHAYLNPVIDTLTLARKWLARRNKEPEQGALRLYALRERYGLPRYNAHNALSDALATAELFLAQVEHMDSRRPPSLGSLMSSL